MKKRLIIALLSLMVAAVLFPASALAEDLDDYMTIEMRGPLDDPLHGFAYVPGDVIKWEVDFTCGDYQELVNIGVTDEEGDKTLLFSHLAPGEKMTATLTHTVTQDDALAGSIEKDFTFSASTHEFSDEEITATRSYTLPASPLYVTVEATNPPSNGPQYVFGETINWKVTVKNVGLANLNDILISDHLSGASWLIETLAPDGSMTHDFPYTVPYDVIIHSGDAKFEAVITARSSDYPSSGLSGRVTDTQYLTTTPAKLTFNLGEGTLDSQTGGSITIDANVGETIKAPGAPTLDGHTFKYWEGSQLQAGEEFVVEGDHDYTAVYEKNADPTPNGDDNGDDNGDGGSGDAEDGSTPKTGDTAPIAALALLAGAALISISMTARRSRTRI